MEDRSENDTAGVAEREARRRLRAISYGMGLALQALVVVIAFAVPNAVKHARIVDFTYAENGACQIGMALEEFKKEYGRYPDASTAVDVKSRETLDWDLSDATSNDLFLQLFVSGKVSEELIFYGAQRHAPPPDERTTGQAEILSAGECGFAYIPEAASASDPLRPVALAPMIPGTLRFDPGRYEGRTVVLRADGSVIAYRIEKDGNVVVNGADLFDPAQPFWKGVAPMVKWQKPGASVPLWDRWRQLLPMEVIGFLVVMQIIALGLMRYGRKGVDRVDWRP